MTIKMLSYLGSEERVFLTKQHASCSGVSLSMLHGHGGYVVVVLAILTLVLLQSQNYLAGSM